jgi:hypothetical protein
MRIFKCKVKMLDGWENRIEDVTADLMAPEVRCTSSRRDRGLAIGPAAGA